MLATTLKNMFVNEIEEHKEGQVMHEWYKKVGVCIDNSNKTRHLGDHHKRRMAVQVQMSEAYRRDTNRCVVNVTCTSTGDDLCTAR